MFYMTILWTLAHFIYNFSFAIINTQFDQVLYIRCRHKRKQRPWVIFKLNLTDAPTANKIYRYVSVFFLYTYIIGWRLRSLPQGHSALDFAQQLTIIPGRLSRRLRCRFGGSRCGEIRGGHHGWWWCCCHWWRRWWTWRSRHDKRYVRGEYRRIWGACGFVLVAIMW